MPHIAAFLVTLLAVVGAAAGDSGVLRIYFVDVEGGQATLFVGPSGQSMLVDAGWPGADRRDALRIAAAARDAGVTKIDYLVTTHYHVDHVGGVPNVAAILPVGTFVDHGESVERDGSQAALLTAYANARGSSGHLVAKPGDTIPLAGLDVQVVAAGGKVVDRALPGGGTANPLCAGFQPKETDTGENALSVGTLITYGKFRTIDLGDLTWNVEQQLACPANLVGPIDLYLTTHHGSDKSGPAVLVQALRPRVAIMNNGAHKGGSVSTWQIVHDSPGLEDLWQLHRALDSDQAHNVSDTRIANPDESTSYWLLVVARQDGSFTVSNQRTGETKSYAARTN
jgi:beta-lactamase superfamily II metal-dependent hydrolase